MDWLIWFSFLGLNGEVEYPTHEGAVNYISRERERKRKKKERLAGTAIVKTSVTTIN